MTSEVSVGKITDISMTEHQQIITDCLLDTKYCARRYGQHGIKGHLLGDDEMGVMDVKSEMPILTAAIGMLGVFCLS